MQSKCEIALGLRLSFNRRYPLFRCAIIVVAVFGDSILLCVTHVGYVNRVTACVYQIWLCGA